MPNTIVTSGNFQYLEGSDQLVSVNTGVTTTVTQSTYVQELLTIPVGSYVQLDTGSLATIRWMVFKNVGTGSLRIAASGSGDVLTELPNQNDVSVISFDSAVTLYAQAYVSNSLLYYTAHNK